MKIKTISPTNMFEPIGPYNHIAKAGPFITISGTPGIDSKTLKIAGDAYSQAKQTIQNIKSMLESVDASLEDIMHIHVFLTNVEDFKEMNRGYAEAFGSYCPSRTVICVADLPKKGALMTMNVTAYIDNSQK